MVSVGRPSLSWTRCGARPGGGPTSLPVSVDLLSLNCRHDIAESGR